MSGAGPPQAQDELQLLERVFLRLGSAETDEQGGSPPRGDIDTLERTVLIKMFNNSATRGGFQISSSRPTEINQPAGQLSPYR